MSGLPLHPFTVRWGDLDPNGHMANTSYLNIAVDTRMAGFAHLGFPVHVFTEAHIGPVVRSDTMVYKRELRLHEAGTVSMELLGLSADGSRFSLRNTFCRHDGVMCAVLDTVGGWLHLDQRKLVPPPDALLAAMRALPRTPEFAELPSSLKGKH